jgi:precorrin-6A/cobalt-precorrin-6A reductase
VRILILGGTGEARALAAALSGRPGLHVVSSLAGRVSNPALPAGEVRIGGFGGVDGLIGYLRRQRVDAVVDATHPFAATITRHAVEAAAAVGLPLVILRRPAWPAQPSWIQAPDIAAAASRVAGLPPGCVLLTTGRRDLAAFAGDDAHHYLVRAVEPPDGAAPPHRTVLLDRGPYTVDGEAALMRQHAVTVLVTKNSGGDLTVAKLVAARERGIPVVVVDRPAFPPGPPVMETVDAVLSWVQAQPPGSGVG